MVAHYHDYYVKISKEEESLIFYDLHLQILLASIVYAENASVYVIDVVVDFFFDFNAYGVSKDNPVVMEIYLVDLINENVLFSLDVD